MRRGELSTGAFGEGYVDRRHPHTYLHELIASGIGSTGPLAYSASVGRGFVPFGTDDPMMRPFEKYPINHHLSQILERGLAIGALRLGPVDPRGEHLRRRRADLAGLAAARAAGSATRGRCAAPCFPSRASSCRRATRSVRSPEQPEGFGLDQRKQSISGRFVSANGDRYLLAEWARTDERDRDRDVAVFGYETALLEGAATARARGPRAATRADRAAGGGATGRSVPDAAARVRPLHRGDHALADRDASPSRPGRDLRSASRVSLCRARAAARLHRAPRRTSSMRASSTADPIWMASVGVRIRYGVMHARMGRYGVALPAGPTLHVLGVDTKQSSAHTSDTEPRGAPPTSTTSRLSMRRSFRLARARSRRARRGVRRRLAVGNRPEQPAESAVRPRARRATR